MLSWRSQSEFSDTPCSLDPRDYLEVTHPKGDPPPLQGPAALQRPVGLLSFPFSRAKDTFLAVVVGQAGQDGGQDPRGVGQHGPAGQLDELPHPAHGCQLDQVVWQREGRVPGRSA